MSNVLAIYGSINSDDVSASTRVANAFLEAYRAKNGNVNVTKIDATQQADFALSKAIIAGNIGEKEQAILAKRGELLEQFKAADVIVIAAPMFNFGLSAQVKEVIDTFCVAGETFKYLDAPDENGNVSVGLATGKKLFFTQGMGGFNVGDKDISYAQIKALFNFIGVTDISYIPVQGTAVPGMEETDAKIEEAKQLAENF